MKRTAEPNKTEAKLNREAKAESCICGSWMLEGSGRWIMWGLCVDCCLGPRPFMSSSVVKHATCH